MGRGRIRKEMDEDVEEIRVSLRSIRLIFSNASGKAG